MKRINKQIKKKRRRRRERNRIIVQERMKKCRKSLNN